MGLLVNGEWKDTWYDTKSTGGRFVREESGFRNWITRDGSGGFSPEPGRYHLYVSLACPWAHRTLIFRKLKKLEEIIPISIVDPYMGNNGWQFGDYPGTIPDYINGAKYLYEIYKLAKQDYTGRVTVPVLWDKKEKTIVNNESSEIIRMMNSEFSDFTDVSGDFYPATHKNKIDEINDYIYKNINNGVYRCGFATTQVAYEEAYNDLFEALERVEDLLSWNRYLVEDILTEADWRLFTTLVRFDPVYFSHFKCNKKMIRQYEFLYNYLRRLYNFAGVKDTVNFDHIKKHYYMSHKSINPTSIVPLGPEQSLDENV